MIQRRVIINLIVFFGLTAVLIVYGYFSLIHNPLDRPTTFYSYIDDTGGVRSGFTVALRGVPIGHVGSVGLAKAPGSTAEQVKVSISVEPGISIPADALVEVERANPLGEQQIDLVPPPGSTAPPAKSGAILPTTSTPTPPDVGQVVNAADRLFAAVPTGDLEVIVHQLAVALNGRAQDIRTIIDESDVLAQNTVAYQVQFRQLLADAPPVLDTVAAVGPQLSDALANTQLLVNLLNQRKNDIVNLFHTGTAFAEVSDQVLQDNTANLACLAKDLGDVGGNLSAEPNYSNLDQALLLNQSFFGPVNDITPVGAAASLGVPGSLARDNQTWVRVRLLLPPQMPSAVDYPKPNQIPDTYPGAACLSVFGNGVPAGSQANAAPTIENGIVIPPPTPTVPVEDNPPPTPALGGSGPGNVLAPGATATAPATAAATAVHTSKVPQKSHPETAVFVIGGLVGLGRLEQRELRKARRALARRRRRRARRGGRR